MSDSTEAGAELRDVVVRFGDALALRGVDVRLPRGGVTVLLGPNGAGKTTAIRVLLGLLPPTSGRAVLLGKEPRDPAARRRVGVMMQVAKVPDMLRVSEHIDTFRSYYPAPLTRAQLIEMAGLAGMERRMFGTLSGGEKQRVLFALALAGNPDLLFLDEPTVGMDIETRRNFRQRIRALADEGRAVLLTTHQMEDAEALADRVIVLRQGRVAADDTPASIRRHIARRRIRCITALAPETIRALCDVDHVTTDGDAVIIVAAAPEAVLRTLFAHDDTLHDLEVTGAGLEDAFVALTNDAEVAA